MRLLTLLTERAAVLAAAASICVVAHAAPPRVAPCPDHRRVLEAYRLDAAPDLSASGIDLALGEYRFKMDAACVGEADLRGAIEKRLRDRHAAAERDALLKDVRAAYPADERLDNLDPARARLLAHLVKRPDLQESLKTADGFKNLVKLVHAIRPDGTGVGELSKHFDSTPVYGDFDEYGASSEPPPPDEKQQSATWKAWVRHTHHRRLDAFLLPSERADRFSDVPTPSIGGILSAVHEPRAGLSQPGVERRLQDWLRLQSTEEIAKYKSDLIALSAFQNSQTSRQALQLLSLLHDPSLTPLFLDHVSREGPTRFAAARALGSIIASHKSASPLGFATTHSWNRYIDQGAPILAKVAAVNGHANDAWRRVMTSNLALTRLMGDEQRARFAARFDDPKALLNLVSVADASKDKQTVDTLLTRFRAMSQGKNLREFLPTGTLEERDASTRLVSSLRAHGLLLGEVRRDPLLTLTLAATGISASEPFDRSGEALHNRGGLHPVPPEFRDMHLDQPRVAEPEAIAEIQATFREKQVVWPPRGLFLRAFKMDKELELWAQSEKGALVLVKTFPICAASGAPGPKRTEGDLQVPEGVYEITQFKPRSSFHVSMGLNYPNASDRIRGGPAPGHSIFIHGKCASIGCLAIEDEGATQLYVASVEARSAGQMKLPIHIFPTRLNGDGLAKLKELHPEKMDFWNELEPLYSRFEWSRTVPSVTIDAAGAYRLR